MLDALTSRTQSERGKKEGVGVAERATGSCRRGQVLEAPCGNLHHKVARWKPEGRFGGHKKVLHLCEGCGIWLLSFWVSSFRLCDSLVGLSAALMTG